MGSENGLEKVLLVLLLLPRGNLGSVLRFELTTGTVPLFVLQAGVTFLE